MSKEITPKEALDNLCDLATPNGDCINYVIGLSGIILKALDRLEQLEIENRNNEKVIADGVKLINRNLELQSRLEALEQANKILESLSKNQHETIENLTNENEILKMNVKDTYDTSQELQAELIEENEKLKKENQDLNAFVNAYANAREELLIRNQNLEKVIEFLKEQFKITLDSKLRISDGVDCIQAFPLLMKSNEVIYDLLKEVLENDK